LLWAALAEQQSLVHAERGGAQHPDQLVADLPAVTVRAVQDIAAPPPAQPRDIGQLIDYPGRDQQPSGGGLQPVVGARPDQVGRGYPVAGQQSVHPVRGGVAGLAGVEDQDRAPGSGQGQCPGQTGGGAANDDDVVAVPAHAGHRAPQDHSTAIFVAVVASSGCG